MTAGTTDRWWQSAIRRAFRLGPQLVAPYEAVHGHDQTTFSPSAYGNYIASSAPVYACANIRARNIARLTLRLYKRSSKGERIEVTSGAMYDLLKSVNPYWTFRRLLRMTELSLCLYGSAFWILETGVRNRTARQAAPREIWWANPTHLRPIPHPTDYLSGYLYSTGQGEPLALDVADVIWFKFDNPVDEYSGLSPLAAARLAIDTSAGAMRSNRQIFENGLQLAGVLGPADKTQSLTREQAEQLSTMLERRFRGADKAHRTAVLTQPVSFTNLSLTPKDAEFLGLMQWSLREVATTFGVPPELIGDKEHATYSNFEQAAKSLWTETLIPQASFLADEITEQLCKLFGNEVDEVEFDLSDIETLQEDRARLIDQLVQLTAIGVPLNRALQELAPRFLPSNAAGYAWGDVGRLPATLQAFDDTYTLEPPPPPPSTPPATLPVPDNSSPPQLPPPTLDEPVAQVPPKQELAQASVQRSIYVYGSPAHVAEWKAFTRSTDRQESLFQPIMREWFRRLEQAVLTTLSAKSAHAGSRKDAGDRAAEMPFNLAEWAKRLKAVGQPQIAVTFEEAARATAKRIAAGYAFDVEDPRAINEIETRGQRFARTVSETTYKQLQDTLAEGVALGEGIPDLQARVATLFVGAKDWRTEAIARTEVVGASNAGALQGALQSGVVESKTWLAALDHRTREWHVEAHGQTVPLEQPFYVHGERGSAPHDFPGASNVVNCRCTMTFGVN